MTRAWAIARGLAMIASLPATTIVTLTSRHTEHRTR